MIKKIFFFQLLLFFLLLNTSAQEKYVMNLKQMLEFAKQNNYEIKEANLEKLKSDQKIKEVRGNGLPQIESTVEYKDYLKLPTMILPGELAGTPGSDLQLSFGTKYNLDAGASLSQLLFSLNYLRGLKVVKKASEIRSLQQEKAKIEMIQFLVNEYYSLMAIYKNLEIIESNLESLGQTRTKTSHLVEGGLALKTNLTRIDLNLANLQTQKDQVLAGIELQENNLKYIIGLDVNSELEVDTTNISQLFSNNELTISKKTNNDVQLENLNEIKLLNENIELNKLQIKQTRAEALPYIAAFASHTYQAQRKEFNFTDSSKDWFGVSVVGFTATIPIFSGLSNKAKVRTEKLKLLNTQDQKEHALSGLKMQFMNALMQYNTSVKNCIVQQQNIALAKEIKDQEELKYNEGQSTLTDLLIAEQDLRSAEINYVQNFISMKQAEVDLLKSEGILEFHEF